MAANTRLTNATPSEIDGSPIIATVCCAFGIMKYSEISKAFGKPSSPQRLRQRPLTPTPPPPAGGGRRQAGPPNEIALHRLQRSAGAGVAAGAAHRRSADRCQP